MIEEKLSYAVEVLGQALDRHTWLVGAEWRQEYDKTELTLNILIGGPRADRRDG
jgi:hypothetical protein